MMALIATLVAQLVEAAGSVVGLRYGPGFAGDRGSGSRSRSRRAAPVDPVIAIGRGHPSISTAAKVARLQRAVSANSLD